ncbi:MAG: histidine kinase dimerization/phosphoacceptor domain -containing protein, partial [Leptolyngbyaceae cyanobacterium bins.59]|nr:histidine kinase dimerization/phosphoacceptor domain -containing protein [Leptolyngbyaceae cyanobacterium bins.59]
NDQGQVTGCVFANTDITDRKRAERTLQQLNQNLEQRVNARTRELLQTVQQLQEEINQRKLAEEQLQASLEEKELLLKEVHHRVKNNLQVVSSLFSLQSQYVKDPKSSALLRESQDRINAMALIHEKLYLSSSLAKIDCVDYLKNLTSSLFASYNAHNQIALHLNVDQVFLSVDTAIRCGMIINELISNALKYAFPQRDQGDIWLNFRVNAVQQLTLTIQDNGVGLPPGLDLRSTRSLGLRLVGILVRKLKGTLEVQIHEGTLFYIVFPLSIEN